MSDFCHPSFRFALPGIRFTLCPGWEITAYEYDTESGRFGISSPERPVCQYSFRKVPALPDMKRIWEEIHIRNFQGEGFDLQFEQWDSGILFVRTLKKERFYASWFNPEQMRLHEWIFPGDSFSAEQNARRLLESVAENLSDANGYTNYALWGLDAKIPAGFELEELFPYPANIELLFENKKHHKIVLRRIGLAAFQLQEDTLARFYQELLMQKKYVVKKCSLRQSGGYEIPSDEFCVRGRFGIDVLLGPWWRGKGEAFFKTDENRIYCMEHIAPARIPERESIETLFEEKMKS